MPAEPFSIRPARPGFMVYEDGNEGSIAFDCRSMEEPPQVMVPAPEHWMAKTPPWAHARRKRIIERLRAAGCVVFEEGDELTTALSLDGSIRVELDHVEDERSGVWTTIQIVRVPGEEVLVSETNYGASSAFAFPRPGVVEVTMTDSAGQRRSFEVNAASRSFRMHPSEADEPLALLPARLGQVDPRPVFAPSPASRFIGGFAVLFRAIGRHLLFHRRRKQVARRP